MNDTGHQLANWRQTRKVVFWCTLGLLIACAVGFGAWAERTKQTVECKR
jgi:hypothetical protein